MLWYSEIANPLFIEESIVKNDISNQICRGALSMNEQATNVVKHISEAKFHGAALNAKMYYLVSSQTML